MSRPTPALRLASGRLASGRLAVGWFVGWLAASLLVGPGLRAQGGSAGGSAEAAARVDCRRCASQGARDCTRHKSLLEQERAVRCCSAAAQCKDCAGALQKDCGACDNPAVERALRRRAELAAAWLQQRRTAVDDVARGQPLLHLQTDHVDLAYGIRPLTVGRDKYDTHAGMHLYGQRIEALRARFLTLLELGEADLASRLEVYMCRDQQGQANLAPAVTGLGTAGAVGVKLMGIETVYCMWMSPRELRDDDDLHRNVVHNLVHLLLSNVAPAGRFGNPGNGWIDEGLAHWFEDQLTGKCTNYCFEEVLMQSGAAFHGGRWRVPVRRMLAAGELVSLATLAPKNSDQLTFPEHAQAFACVDFLLTVHGGPKFRDFVRGIKQGKAMRDSMQEVYGLHPLAFDKEFQAWIEESYPLHDR